MVYCTASLPLLLLLLVGLLAGEAFAEQCGRQAGGALCPGGLCCSQFGWCGSTSDYCGPTCQSQCGGVTPSPGGGVASLISQSVFNQMLKHRNDAACQAKGFYTYNAFIAAANSFNGFASVGDTATRKREIAAFLAQTSHETTGECSWNGLLSFIVLVCFSWIGWSSDHMCIQVDGLLRRMAHMLGDIAFSRSKEIRRIIVCRLPNGRVLPVKNTTGVDQFRFHSKFFIF